MSEHEECVGGQLRYAVSIATEFGDLMAAGGCWGRGEILANISFERTICSNNVVIGARWDSYDPDFIFLAIEISTIEY